MDMLNMQIKNTQVNTPQKIICFTTVLLAYW